MGKLPNQSIATFYGLHHDKGNISTLEKKLLLEPQSTFNQNNQIKGTKLYEH